MRVEVDPFAESLDGGDDTRDKFFLRQPPT